MKHRIAFAMVLLVARLSEAQVAKTPASELGSPSTPSYSVLVQSLANGTIYRRDSHSSSFEPFITGLPDPVDLILGADGALYYQVRKLEIPANDIGR